MTHLCVEYKEAIRELCQPECASFGVNVKCEKCKGTWGKRDREWFNRRLEQAQVELETVFDDTPLCPSEICQEKVYLSNCPLKLEHRPIAYLGKKVLVETRTLTICYAELSDCGADLPASLTPVCNEDNDEIGTVLVTDIPPDVTLDTIEFRFPEFLCYNTKQELPSPECLQAIECDDEIVGIEAIWPKCFLIHPHCDKVRLSDDNCFLVNIDVLFYVIDESLAIEIPAECQCGACLPVTSCTVEDIEIELGDPLQGEVCITAEDTLCYCENPYVYVNYATALNCGDPDPNINRAVALLTLIRVGDKRWCNCEGSNDYIEYLMEIDPSVTRENASPFEGVNRFPYGKTRAGVELAHLVEVIRQRMINEGTLETRRGGFIGGLDRRKMQFRQGRRW